MAITIKDVAREAGVSIATVSHVINGTRYVKPELTEKVLQAIRNTNYQVKAEKKPGTARLGEKSVIAVVIPNVGGSLFTKIITCITQLCESRGYSVSIYLTFDDAASEKRILENLVGSRQTAGIIIAPCGLAFPGASALGTISFLPVLLSFSFICLLDNQFFRRRLLDKCDMQNRLGPVQPL